MEVLSIYKEYNNVSILKDISLKLKKGEIIGLVGRNGAGKSTLMKIFSKSIPTFQGKVEHSGRLGYFIENPKLYENKSGRWHLTYFSKIFDRNFNLDEYHAFYNSIGLLEELDKKTKFYSLGMKQKLGVAISLLNNPDYIILDEPTNGMDIDSSIIFLEELTKIVQEKDIGVLISSHKLEDIEMICDRVVFLDNGEIISEQSDAYKKIQIVSLTFETVDDLKKFITNQNLGVIVEENNTFVKIETKSVYSEIIEFLSQLNINLLDYSSEFKTLRSIYIDKIIKESYK